MVIFFLFKVPKKKHLLQSNFQKYFFLVLFEFFQFLFGCSCFLLIFVGSASFVLSLMSHFCERFVLLFFSETSYTNMSSFRELFFLRTVILRLSIFSGASFQPSKVKKVFLIDFSQVFQKISFLFWNLLPFLYSIGDNF